MYHKYHISCVSMNYWGMSKAQTIFTFVSLWIAFGLPWCSLTESHTNKLCEGPRAWKIPTRLGDSKQYGVSKSSMEAELRKDRVSKNGTLLSIHELDLLVRMRHLSYRSLDLEVASCVGSAITRKLNWVYLRHTCHSYRAHDNDWGKESGTSWNAS